MVSRLFVAGAAMLVFAAALCATGVAAQNSWELLPTYGLTLEQARAGLQAAMDLAHKVFPSVAFSICILDPATRMKAFVRLDDVPYTIHSVACNKAKGALQIATNTQVSQSYPLGPGQLMFHFQDFNGFFTTIPGGVLIRDPVTGNVTGAIGASGSFNATNDVEVATAGANAIMAGLTRPITVPLVPPPTAAANDRKRDSLPLQDALQRLEAAMQAAYATKTSSQAISVLDHFGNTVASHIMDGTLLISYDLTITKGLSAVNFDGNSKNLTNQLQNVTGRWFTFDGAMAPAKSYYTAFGGGVRFLSTDGKTLGAIACSGASSDVEDTKYAEEGAKIVATVARKPVLALNDALTAVQSALNNAGGYRAAAIVLDIGGNVVAYASHDGVAAGAFDVCKKKALTAVFAPVEYVLPAVRPGQAAYSLQYTNAGMVVYAGATQLVDSNNNVLGVIGVWTDAYDNVQSVEKACVDAAANDFKTASARVTLSTFSPSNAFTQPAPRAYAGELISLSQATQAALGAVNHSPAPGSVAVRDGRGELRLFVRSDGAPFGSVDLALKTSRTSYLFPYPSHRLQPYLNPTTGTLYTLDMTNDRLVVTPGGLPLTNANDQLVGSVGVNYGMPDDDTLHDVLQAAEAFFLSAGGSGVGVASASDCGKDYKGSFTAALTLLILLGLALLGIVLYWFIRGGKRDAPTGYREQT